MEMAPIDLGTALLAGIRAGGINLHRLPGARAGHQWLGDESGTEVRPLTVAGAAQVRLAFVSSPSCFPLNCSG